MIVKARIETVKFQDFDIPEFLAEAYEKEIEMFVPQGQHVNHKTLLNWCRAKGIKLVPVYE